MLTAQKSDDGLYYDGVTGEQNICVAATIFNDIKRICVRIELYSRVGVDLYNMCVCVYAIRCKHGAADSRCTSPD